MSQAENWVPVPPMNNQDSPHLSAQNWTRISIPRGLRVEPGTLSSSYGRFIVEPLERGFAITLGNALRRVLLAATEGSAVFAVQIEGVTDEFASLEGIRENVTQLLLNLKEVQVNQLYDGIVELEMNAQGPGVLRAGDINDPEKAEILNPSHVIAHLAEGAALKIKIFLRMNCGYITAEENQNVELPTGTFFLDSHHSPIRRINYEVENARFEQKTDYDRLIFELWTNGSIKPQEAIGDAAQFFKEQLQLFINFDETIVTRSEEPLQETAPEPPDWVRHLPRSIHELELSVRSINCLQNAKIESIGELVQKSEPELLKFKNFGRKSLNEIKTVLETMGLSLGMDLTGHYPADAEAETEVDDTE